MQETLNVDLPTEILDTLPKKEPTVGQFVDAVMEYLQSKAA